MTNKTSILTDKERKRLKPRSAPYGWVVADRGVYVGYRRIEGQPGTWIARVQKLQGDHGLEKRIQHKSLGPATGSLTLPRALQAAREWAAELRKGVSFTGSVWAVAEAYMTDPKVVREKTPAELAQILKRFLRIIQNDPIGAIPVNELNTFNVRDFRARLIESGMAEATVNRELSALRALLSWGFEHDLIADDVAWRKVKLFKGVSHKERPTLTLDECRRLIDAAEPEVARVIRALLYTGHRPGPSGILGAVRSDYEPPKGNRTHGRFHGHTRKGGTGGKAFFTELTPEGTAFFTEICRTDPVTGLDWVSPPDALLFPGPDGLPWKHERAFSIAFARAVKAAGLPEDTVPYQLRHTAISEWIAKGVSLTTIARWVGTSIQQIDRTYGKLVEDTEIHKLSDHSITGE